MPRRKKTVAAVPNGDSNLRDTRDVFRRLAVQQQQQLETVRTRWRETLRFMQSCAGAKEWSDVLGSDGFGERLRQARQALNELEAVDTQYRRTLEECTVLSAAAEGRLNPEQPGVVAEESVVTSGTGSVPLGGASDLRLDHDEQTVVTADT